MQELTRSIQHFYFNSANIYGITFLKHLENILYEEYPLCSCDAAIYIWRFGRRGGFSRLLRSHAGGRRHIFVEYLILKSGRICFPCIFKNRVLTLCISIYLPKSIAMPTREPRTNSSIHPSIHMDINEGT